MPHSRKRYLSTGIAKALKYSPIVGLIGQRQVGKTTLLNQNVAEYVSLDRESHRLLADKDPETFLGGHQHPYGIDEAQLSPKLFPALKEHVRLNKAPGQFLITGSVRFTSRKVIRESLTGRIVSLELLPFTLSEIEGLPLPETIVGLMKDPTEKKLVKLLEKNVRHREAFARYLETGGLPGICFFRDVSVRREKFEGQLDTILNRDFRLIYPTTLLYASLRRLLVFLAEHQGEPLKLVEAARESQISTVTLPKVLFALEALFLIRPIEGRGIHKTSYFLEDQGMASWLMRSSGSESRNIIRGLYSNLRQELWYRRSDKTSLFQWRTRNGAEVPLVFQNGEDTLGVIPTGDSVPTPKVMGSANSFLRSFPRGKVVIANAKNEIRVPNARLVFLPYWSLV